MHQGMPFGRESSDPSAIHHHHQPHSTSQQTPPGFVASGVFHDYSTNAPSREQPSFDNNNTGAARTVILQNSNSPVPSLRRHHSTGSQHFVVNSRGEIIGTSSPVVTRGSFEGYNSSELGHHQQLYPQQQLRGGEGMNGYVTGNNASPFAQRHAYNQSKEGTPRRFHRLPSHDEARACYNPTMDGKSEAIGVEYQVQHCRNHTEPMLSYGFEQSQAMKNQLPSVQQPSFCDDNYERVFSGENIEGMDDSRIDGQSPNPSKTGDHRQAYPFAPQQIHSRSLPSSSPMEQMSATVTGRGPRYSQIEPQLQPVTAGGGLTKSGPRMVYNVKFKRTQRNFVLGQRITRDIKIGCYVKVEADRGEDLGIVLCVTPMEKFVAASRSKPMHGGLSESISGGDVNCQLAPNTNTSIGDLKRIMRVATHDEITLLEVKREEEDELLRVCSAKVRQRGLPMVVVDAEYQFDRHKLTFFFEAEGRIDFRELVRDLFSMYKTRIWMQQLDKATGGNNDIDISKSKSDEDTLN